MSVHETARPDEPLVPAMCPACRSTDVATASKTIDDTAYWRCRACGEVWNVRRRQENSAWPPARPWKPGRF